MGECTRYIGCVSRGALVRLARGGSAGEAAGGDGKGRQVRVEGGRESGAVAGQRSPKLGVSWGAVCRCVHASDGRHVRKFTLAVRVSATSSHPRPALPAFPIAPLFSQHPDRVHGSVFDLIQSLARSSLGLCVGYNLSPAAIPVAIILVPGLSPGLLRRSPTQGFHRPLRDLQSNLSHHRCACASQRLLNSAYALWPCRTKGDPPCPHLGGGQILRLQ